MIAHESTSEHDEGDGDDRDTRRRSAKARLTNLELRVGTLKLPPMWEIKDLAVRLRLPPATGPYATAFRLLMVLLAILLAAGTVFHLPMP